MSAQYVYGVVSSGARVTARLAGLDGQPVGTVPHLRCAGVVSDLTTTRPLGARGDLVAHQGVLAALTEAGVAVLPLRFGTVLGGREAVTDLLADGEASFEAALDRVQGRAEFRLKARYLTDTVVAEVLGEEPGIAALAARVRGVPDDAGYYDRIGLGQAIAAALGRKAEAEARRMLEALTPHADAVAMHPTGQQDEVLDAAFLIELSRRRAFEDAVGDLAAATAGRVRLRLAGPLPPYDFTGRED